MTARVHRALFTLALLGVATAGFPRLASGQQRDRGQVSALREISVVQLTNPTQTVRAAKSPGIAALISLLITGGGQMYNEETTKGVIMLVAAVGFTALAIDGIDEYDCDPFEECSSWLLPVGLSGALALKVWSIIDASAGATRWNVRHNLAGLRVGPAVGLRPLRGGNIGVSLLGASF